MKVILLQNIKGLGQIGDVKNVSDGYGRNFLLANNLAKLATESGMKEAESLKKKADVDTKLAQEKANEAAEKLKDVVLEFTKKSSKAGTLFASLTKKEVADKISEIAGGKITPDMINFKEHGEHIKHEGEHLIGVELTPEIKIELRVLIKSE